MNAILPFPDSTPAAAPDVISDGSTATFVQDVIETSMTTPVVVDFWAPWCGPCKQLMPLLEKHVAAAGGKVRMVKIDIDQNQQLAAQLRVQSVPTVFAFFQGQPVDAFMGLQPESQIKQFVERLAKVSRGGAPGAPDLTPHYEAATAAMANNQPDEAALIYNDILQAIPTEIPAHIGLLRAQLAMGQADIVAQAIAVMPDEVKKHKDFAALQTALDLAQQAADAGPLADLQAAVDKAPADHQARYDLAAALFSAGQVDDAFDQLFIILNAQPDWNEGQARQQVLKFCETIGLEDTRGRSARRRLSAIIFK